MSLYVVLAVIAIVAVASIATVLYYQGQNNNISPSPSPSPTPTSTITPSPSPTPSPSSPLPVTLTDDMGNELTLTAFPNRIVSLAPANTQILFAVGAGDKVIGVTDYDNYPYNFSAWVEAKNMSSIGSYFNPAIEPIVELNPDLVVASLGSSDAATQLRSLGYNVIVLNPADLDGVLSNILKVGKATNHEAEATTLVNNLQQRIDAVEQALVGNTERPKVYNEVWSDPFTSVGQGTFIDGLIEMAGGQNIFENSTTAYPEVSSEAVIEQNPDIIIFPSSMGVDDFWGSFTDVANRPGWNSIAAIKNNAMFTINGDMINQPGPRQVDALEILAKIIHPEIFGGYTQP